MHAVRVDLLPELQVVLSQLTPGLVFNLLFVMQIV